MSNQDPRGGGGQKVVAEPPGKKKVIPGFKPAKREGEYLETKVNNIITQERRIVLNRFLNDIDGRITNENISINSLKTNLDQKKNITKNNNLKTLRQNEGNLYRIISEKVKFFQKLRDDIVLFYENIPREEKVIIYNKYRIILEKIDSKIKYFIGKLRIIQESIVNLYTRIFEKIQNEVQNILDSFSLINNSNINSKIDYIRALKNKIEELKEKSILIRESFRMSGVKLGSYTSNNKFLNYIDEIVNFAERNITNSVLPNIKQKISNISRQENNKYRNQLETFKKCLSQFFDEVNILDTYFKELKSKINSVGITDIDLPNVEIYYQQIREILQRKLNNITKNFEVVGISILNRNSTQSVNIAAQSKNNSSSGGASVVSL
jgi:hypothetical protein